MRRVVTDFLDWNPKLAGQRGGGLARVRGVPLAGACGPPSRSGIFKTKQR